MTSLATLLRVRDYVARYWTDPAEREVIACRLGSLIGALTIAEVETVLGVLWDLDRDVELRALCDEHAAEVERIDREIAEAEGN